MAGSSVHALRRAWWQVHKWIALVLMILLMPLGLSGGILAWDDAVDHALNPARYAVSGPVALPPSAYARAAMGAIGPDDRIAAIRYPDGAGPVTVSATRVAPKGAKRGGPPMRTTVWLDPKTAKVLDAQRGNAGLVRLAHAFHGSLFVPGQGVGRALVGVLGIAMFLLAATGIWLWWPTVGSLGKAFRWVRGDRHLSTNLHHTVGIWICIPLAFQAFTGAWIAWPQMMQVVGIAPARGPGGPGGGFGRGGMMPADETSLSPEQALAAAQARTPGDPAAIAWPTSGPDAAWRISIQGAKGDVSVDDATAEASPAGERQQGLAGLIRHLHDGSAIGWGWRLLMTLWAIAPTVLGITGILMWLRGRRWRNDLKRRQRARATADPVAAE